MKAWNFILQCIMISCNDASHSLRSSTAGLVCSPLVCRLCVHRCRLLSCHSTPCEMYRLHRCEMYRLHTLHPGAGVRLTRPQHAALQSLPAFAGCQRPAGLQQARCSGWACLASSALFVCTWLLADLAPAAGAAGFACLHFSNTLSHICIPGCL
jgi:hypothetical protein